MARNKLAEAFVDVRADMGALKRNIGAAAGIITSRLGIAGATAGRAIGAGISSGISAGVTAGIATAIAAIGGIGLSVKFAKDAEEIESKFQVVFGTIADDARKFGDTLADAIGRSRIETKKFLSESQDLFQPLGFDKGLAFQLSKQVTQLAFDLASFNNVADSDALRDLQAALTGSGEVMKKYGVIVSEAAVKQRLLNEGFDPKIASDQQKVMARLAIILDGTAAAQGDALRTSESLANQLKRLKASFFDAGAAVGTIFAPAIKEITALMSDIVLVIREQEPTFRRWGQAIGAAVKAGLAPVRAFFQILRTSAGDAFLFAKLQFSSLLDRLLDGLKVIARAFATTIKGIGVGFQKLIAEMQSPAVAEAVKLALSGGLFGDPKQASLDAVGKAFPNAAKAALMQIAKDAPSIFAGIGQDSARTAGLRKEAAARGIGGGIGDIAAKFKAETLDLAKAFKQLRPEKNFISDALKAGLQGAGRLIGGASNLIPAGLAAAADAAKAGIAPAEKPAARPQAEFFGLTDFSREIQRRLGRDPALAAAERTATGVEKLAGLVANQLVGAIKEGNDALKNIGRVGLQ